VQHGSDADTSAEVLGIRRDGEQRLSGGLKQDIVDHRLVLIGNVGDRRRESEDQVEVGYGQELGRTLGEPLPSGGALALRVLSHPTPAFASRFCALLLDRVQAFF
jgi:hypothetical protein